MKTDVPVIGSSRMWRCGGSQVFRHDVGEDGVLVADVYGDTAAEDARLVAAAPELLRCCEQLWNMAAECLCRHGDPADFRTRQSWVLDLIAIRGYIESVGGEVKHDQG